MTIISLMDEENVKHAVSTAETSLKECWAKLILLQSAAASKEDQSRAFTSFQPALLSALVELESFYNEVCEFRRELIVDWNKAQRVFLCFAADRGK